MSRLQDPARMVQSGQSPMPTLRVIDPRRARRQRLWLLVLWLSSVAIAYVVGRYVIIPDAGGLRAQLEQTRAAESELRRRLGETEQRLANLERAEQIARMANENVQVALTDKEAELARLRRDLALFERLFGPDVERQGLSVQEVSVQPSSNGDSVRFSVIATRTREVRGNQTGRLTLSVEGQHEGRLQRLDWADLAPTDSEQGLDYDFRYFQRIEGSFLLPEGFQPLTIQVRLIGRDGERAERSVRWQQALVSG